MTVEQLQELITEALEIQGELDTYITLGDPVPARRVGLTVRHAEICKLLGLATASSDGNN